MAIDNSEIKELVRERYGARAQRVIELSPVVEHGADQHTDSCGCDVSASCCGPEDMEHAMRLYNDGQLAGLPAESIAASAGCGNPTALAGLQPGERVLDLGSGGGIDCFIAAEQVGESGRVFGLDMTPDMLALANANRDRMGLNNVEFIEGHLEDIPLPDASVDVVISNCVICLAPDKDAVFREAYRVLTPGGRLHVSDMLALTEEGPAIVDAQSWASCVGGAEYKETYLGRMVSAGFQDIATTQDEMRVDENAVPLNVASVKVSAYKPR
jgi:SAM-dependent methyltransferase